MMGFRLERLPTGYIDGIVCTVTGTWTASLGAGVARDQDDSMDIEVSAPLALDVNTTGAGGRQASITLSAGLSLWVFVIADSTGVNPVAAFADTATTPTLPAGYDRYVLAWRVRVNAANTDLIPCWQIGAGKLAIWTTNQANQVFGQKTSLFGTRLAVSLTPVTGGSIARVPGVLVAPGHLAPTTDSCSVFNSVSGAAVHGSGNSAITPSIYQASDWVGLTADSLWIDRTGGAGGSATQVYISVKSVHFVRGAI